MDAKFINPVLKSVVNILQTMAQITPQPGKPEIKSDDIACGVISGFIDLSGRDARVSVAVTFSKEAILDIGSRMMHMELKEVDDIIKDLVGEMANMVAGGAKANLQEAGYDFDLTLPSIVVGEKHQVKHSVEGVTLIMPFSIEAGQFYVEVCAPD
ncbi:MAG: chemotaxis protein CheX [Thiotrichaceae bacterium]|nr:chemotaxis protein CheX [Thiotrichaceae bacterium]PCI15076.1 MAG: chemotaxis protein CheX [Thiotrichales bacterium]